MTQIQLTVLTPERTLLSVDRATKVRLRLGDGAWLSVYPGHAPLIAEVPTGPVQYETDVESGELLVGGGILRIHGDEVTLLTSGLIQQQDAGAAEVDERFDRLARDLMHALGAHQQNTEQDEGAW